MQDTSADRNFGGGTTTDTHAGTFAREVLMSYRLIFGQNKRSWKAYRTLKVHLHATTGMELDDHDPLLDRLCGQPWQKERRFYADVESLDACFLPSDGLPFLGPRLLRLQQFSQSQTPTSWTVLWYDRRNLCKAPQTCPANTIDLTEIVQFYTFWAFILVGVGTILTGIFQIAFAIWAVVVAYKQTL